MPVKQRLLTLVRHNLPTPQTSFIGRVQAIAELCRLLRTTRILTLTGSGGSGKTRLALRVAEEMIPSFPGGICWVDLAPLNQPDLLAQTVAGALGLREEPSRPALELIQEHLRRRVALLVLDNCEHLRAACAELIGAILTPDSPASVLATSREPLGVAGERVWLVPLLSLPAPGASIGQQRAAEAVRLFVERARAVAPPFALSERNAAAVAQICRRLEGLPLAIELAAARVAVLAPQQIAARLDNSMGLLTRGSPASDARHRMLRAAIDWSYDLLSADEQALFCRLAVFAAGFDLEAVEAVCAGEGLIAGDLLDLLARLVEQSLLVATEQGEQMRYRLLEPVRHYAVERLEAGGNAEGWRERHAAYYLALAERAEPELRGPDQDAWLDRLERDHDNLRAALDWCAATARVVTGLRLCSAMYRFWLARGHFGEGQGWLQRFLPLADATAAPELHSRALNANAGLAAAQSDFAAARLGYEQSLILARRAEDDALIAETLSGLGVTCWELGDNPAAQQALEQAVQLSREAGPRQTLASALSNLALVYQYRGEVAQARAYYEEALELSLELGHLAGEATIRFNLAALAKHGGDQLWARLHYQEALAIYRRIGDRARVADVLASQGQLLADLGEFAAAAQAFAEAEQIYSDLGKWGDLGYVWAGRGDMAFYEGRYDQARDHYFEALRIFRAAGNRRLSARALGGLARAALRTGDLAAGAELCAEALRLRLEIGHRAGMVFALEGECPELALAAGRPVVAARLLGAAEAAREALGRPPTPMELRAGEPARRSLHEQLGPAGLATHLAEGRAMSLEQAAAYALDSLDPAALSRPEPELRIFALGPLRFYRGDRLLTAADWTYAKARELVLYLLCHPDATRERIGLEFWPDATAEQVRQRFSAALAHARSALGREREWIGRAGGRYSFNRAGPYCFDVDLFETDLEEARKLIAAGHTDRAIQALEQAVGRYQGDLAEDVLDGDWLVVRRAALRQAYLEALLSLGRLYAAAGRDEQAIAAFQRAVARDAYLEEAHHELIGIYLRLKRRRQALAQYEALAAALAGLGVAPSPEISAQIEGLRRGDG